ncbi:diacylglycerol O-acyltransferase 1 [Physocladia obscura]|uniref:Diacylglycerol O-acyltransferase n=1 Tax=Physocladia obscura TaxID=109957 RepID=A0AAD5SXC3_9FUNG|nr:diacylglycerol O-acyltransferase 1 [Physocladia obscura]
MLGTEIVEPPLDTEFEAYNGKQQYTVLEWIFTSLFVVIVVPGLIVALLIAYPIYVLPMLLVYGQWAYGVEGNTQRTGGWGITYWGIGLWSCNRHVWSHFREYFRAHIVRTAPLPPGRNYLLCVHPHGVYVLGLVANVINNRRVFAQLFPSLTLRITTLELNFRVPLWREILLSQGAVSVDKDALEHVLTETNARGEPAGNILTLVVGAAEEFQLMEPHTMDLVLNKRRGFVKLALTTGADLVPLITFGENDTWRRETNGLLVDINKFLKKYLKFVIPELQGRDGNPFMPLPAKLVTVIGAPIHVDRVENPSAEVVNSLHQRYVEALFKLYDSYKDDFFKDRVRDMRLVK